MIRNRWGILGVLAVLVVSCAPAPRHQLTTAEKIQDLEWVYNQYDKHYAPLTYKEERQGFQYEALKQRYRELAAETTNNAEFYALVHSFVSEFADAHNSGAFLDAGLPGRHQVAYLGFEGKRKGNRYVVEKLLPTVSVNSSFPIKVGMEITHVDGTPIVEYVRENLTTFRDLGQEEANLTYLMSRIFTRSSLGVALPENDMVTLTVQDSGEEKVFELRWVKQDLYEFNQEQTRAARAEIARLEKAPGSESSRSKVGFLETFLLGMDYLSGKPDVLASVYDFMIRQSPRYKFWDTFQFIDTLPTWGSESTARMVRHADVRIRGSESRYVTEMNAGKRLREERNVPSHASIVNNNAIYPWYHRLEAQSFPVMDGEKRTTEEVRRRVAYMRLDTFSPDTLVITPDGQFLDINPVEQVKEMLDLMVHEGIHDLVIDMVDNGGGSLVLGLELAQALSSEKIKMPGIRFKLSEEWLDDFQSQTIFGSSPEERERAEAVFNQLLGEFEDRPFGLSTEFPIESLAPHAFQPNLKLRTQGSQGKKEPYKLNIVVMVNEMCASMCDIFTAVLKDNQMATVVGAKTMGAGGNVVNSAPDAAPNSHFTISRTESLIVRSNGEYIENQGIEPDVKMAVNESVSEKYEPVRRKAIETLLRKYVTRPIASDVSQ